MSTQILTETDLPQGAPELTALGKRLEILRIERGISKQRLARHAGTSRQQLWRVMTGKSELTSSLRERLATALDVQPVLLSHATVQLPYSSGAVTTAAGQATAAQFVPGPPTVTDYLGSAQHFAATLHTLPSGDGGRFLKRALLNALEDLALQAGRALPVEYSEIRRRVLAGEL